YKLSYPPHLLSYIRDRDNKLSYLPHLPAFIKDRDNKLRYLPHLPAFIKDQANKLSYLPHLPNRTYRLPSYTLFDITAPNFCQLHLFYKICTQASVSYTFFQKFAPPAPLPSPSYLKKIQHESILRKAVCIRVL